MATSLALTIPLNQIAGYCQRNQILELALFGSVLRDDFDTDSDVDVLVEFEPEAHIGFLALGRIQRELGALFGRRVDVVPKTGLKPVIRDDILRSAMVIYAC